MDTFIQASILISGAAAIWLVNQKGPVKRWGSIIGLIGQPFWFYTTISAGQWGMVALSSWYTYAWLHGIRNHWFKPQEK